MKKEYYTINQSWSSDSTTMQTFLTESDARDYFEKQVALRDRDEKPDTKEWDDDNLGWHDVYYLELIKWIIGEDGEFEVCDTLAYSDYYWF